jgi:hypothetical protein
MSADRKQLVLNLYQGFFHREPNIGELAAWTTRMEAGLSVDKIVEIFLKSSEFANVRKKVHSLFVTPGHFYSPIVNVDEVREVFKTRGDSINPPAINISMDAHAELWKKLLPYLNDIPFPEEKTDEYRYFFKNPAFSYGDGSILHAMLRCFRPRRLVEVGCGYSSACAVDTIDRYLDGKVDVEFVEPYPDLLIRLLGEELAKRYTIHVCFVQKADMQIFNSLEDGDFLFIDSSHVIKTGSDVCHELFNILPTLKPGVFIHFHDIFWPFEYGQDWVLKENRSWNEIYGLRAFLMYNESFEIVFHNDFFVKTCRNLVQESYPTMLKNSGGSIWLRKVR